MNKQEYYSNFQRHLKDGRRIALFGRELSGYLEIFEEKCSKSDQFSKKKAHEIYNLWLSNYHEIVQNYKILPTYGMKYDAKTGKFGSLLQGYRPRIEYIKLDKNSAKFEFDEYCKNFYKKDTRAKKYIEEYLYNNKEEILTKTPPKRLLKLRNG